MKKKLYIAPETTVMEINESLALLQASLEGKVMESDEDIRLQSKEHDSFNDFSYNTWEEWDNTGSSLWD